jgi:hypothetical protein
VVETAVPSPTLLQDVRDTLTPLTQHIVAQRLAKTEREASFGQARGRAGAAVTEAWAARGETVGAAALLVALDTVEGEWCREKREGETARLTLRLRADSITRWRRGGTGEVVRRQILSGSRCDGRALDELRPIHGEVALLPPVVHGSSLFCRGDTQALATVTVGSMDGPPSTPHPPATLPLNRTCTEYLTELVGYPRGVSTRRQAKAGRCGGSRPQAADAALRLSSILRERVR